MTTVDECPLEFSKVIKKTIDGVIGWLFLLAILTGAISYFTRKFYTDIFWLLILVFIAEAVYQYYYYKLYYYDVRKDFLVIKKGVITPKETILNYTKIQDVYVDQDILDRILGLYDVHVSTASSLSGAEAHIDGINHQNAETIRGQILKKIRKR
ncbi:PH domain-containing protein [Candidatus Woesearchaeota archaeon]|nr:PH domain-containing protein [Candidatus Woesearchaeota archaeon]